MAPHRSKRYAWTRDEEIRLESIKVEKPKLSWAEVHKEFNQSRAPGQPQRTEFALKSKWQTLSEPITPPPKDLEVDLNLLSPEELHWEGGLQEWTLDAMSLRSLDLSGGNGSHSQVDLLDFFARDELARNQVRDLGYRNQQLMSDIHSQGTAAQNDRLLLANAHSHIHDLQGTINQSDQARARMENSLNELRQEMQQVQYAFARERDVHAETKKQLRDIHRSNNRMADIIKDIRGVHNIEGAAEAGFEKEYEITLLLLELEQKTATIRQLQQKNQHLDDKLKKDEVAHREQIQNQRERLTELNQVIIGQQVDHKKRKHNHEHKHHTKAISDVARATHKNLGQFIDHRSQIESRTEQGPEENAVVASVEG
ncbi:hypothetical protein MMC25_007326 [Agyrium rufum]|nr:hypothetical protein [Agyrium rufum]